MILGFIYGIIFSSLFEVLIINFVYLSNISLFEDLFLTKKNKDKLKKYYSSK